MTTTVGYGKDCCGFSHQKQHDNSIKSFVMFLVFNIGFILPTTTGTRCNKMLLIILVWLVSIPISTATPRENCGTNKWCYFTNIYPSVNHTTHATATIQNIDDNAA
eukprot:508954_1